MLIVSVIKVSYFFTPKALLRGARLFARPFSSKLFGIPFPAIFGLGMAKLNTEFFANFN